MKCKYLLASDACVIDRVTGSFSLYNIIDFIQTANPPFLIPRLSISALFMRDEGDRLNEECMLNIEINGKNIFEQRQDIAFTEQSGLNRSLTIMQGIVVPEIGALVIKFSKNDAVLSEWIINIRALPSPTVQNVTSPPQVKRKRAKGDTSTRTMSSDKS